MPVAGLNSAQLHYIELDRTKLIKQLNLNKEKYQAAIKLH